MSLMFRLGFIGFVTALSARCVDPIVPFIADGLRVDPAAVALLSTAFALPFALAQPVLGPLADMAGKIRLMIVCLAILTAALFVSSVATSYPVLFAARVVAGMATGGIFPVGLAIIGDLVPVLQRQVTIARWLTVVMIGNLLGASFAGIVNDLASWRVVFAIIAVLCAAVLAMALVTLRHAAREHKASFDLRSVPAGYRGIFGNPRAKFCYGAVFFEAVAIFGLFPFVALLLLAAGEDRASIAGIVIGGFSLGGVLYSLIVPVLLRIVLPERMMLAGGIVSALMLVFIAFQLAWQVQFLAFTVLGFAFFMLHGSIQVQATELSATARGAATALHAFFFFMGQATGPVLFGLGLTAVGAAPTIVAGGAIMLVVGIVCALYLRGSRDVV